MDMGLKEAFSGRVGQIGQVVISRKGKDAGRWYVIVGFSEDHRRVYIADGLKFTVRRPKAKNTIHLQLTSLILDEMATKILSGQEFDPGRFQVLLRCLREMGGREETVCPTKTK